MKRELEYQKSWAQLSYCSSLGISLLIPLPVSVSLTSSLSRSVNKQYLLSGIYY